MKVTPILGLFLLFYSTVITPKMALANINLCSQVFLIKEKGNQEVVDFFVRLNSSHSTSGRNVVDGRTYEIEVSSEEGLKTIQLRSPRIASITYEAGPKKGQTVQVLYFDRIKNGKYDGSTGVDVSEIASNSVKILPKILTELEQQIESVLNLPNHQYIEFLDRNSREKRTVHITSKKVGPSLGVDNIKDGKYNGSTSIETNEVDWNSVRIVPGTRRPFEQILADITTLPKTYAVEFMDSTGVKRLVRITSPKPQQYLSIDNLTAEGNYNGSTSIDISTIQWDTVRILPNFPK
ncbi:MAG: hypothetical protein ACXVBQ_16605 [Pseudobdellovibrionaceae bacterium]